jgi:hypothetical protein
MCAASRDLLVSIDTESRQPSRCTRGPLCRGHRAQALRCCGRVLENARSPLLGPLMECTRMMLKEYKAELEDIFAADKQVRPGPTSTLAMLRIKLAQVYNPTTWTNC